jgi:hypothetical protein
MELKNVYPNGDNVVASNPNNANFFFFLETMKIEFKNKHHVLLAYYHLEVVVIVQKTKSLILFTPLINMIESKPLL